jgi:hypothetical protein
MFLINKSNISQPTRLYNDHDMSLPRHCFHPTPAQPQEIYIATAVSECGNSLGCCSGDAIQLYLPHRFQSLNRTV